VQSLFPSPSQQGRPSAPRHDPVQATPDADVVLLGARVSVFVSVSVSVCVHVREFVRVRVRVCERESVNLPACVRCDSFASDGGCVCVTLVAVSVCALSLCISPIHTYTLFLSAS